MIPAVETGEIDDRDGVGMREGDGSTDIAEEKTTGCWQVICRGWSGDCGTQG